MSELLVEQQPVLSPELTAAEVEVRFAEFVDQVDDAHAEGSLRVPETLSNPDRDAKATSGPDAKNLLYMK